MGRKTSYRLGQLVYSAMFLALALLLPFLTAQIKTFGVMLCPMHIPVIICGFVCGPFWGMAVGACAPILRSLLFGMPGMFPDAFAMAFELAVYAFVAGMLYKKLNKNIFMTYVTLLTSMVSGRLVWGLVMFVLILAGKSDETIGLALIWTGTVTSCIPGIVLQLVAIPPIISVLRQNRLLMN